MSAREANNHLKAAVQHLRIANDDFAAQSEPLYVARARMMMAIDRVQDRLVAARRELELGR